MSQNESLYATSTLEGAIHKGYVRAIEIVNARRVLSRLIATDEALLAKPFAFVTLH